MTSGNFCAGVGDYDLPAAKNFVAAQFPAECGCMTTAQYVKVDVHMPCPNGYATIHERESCVAAANATLDFLCYGAPWENALRTESSPQMPAGCYFDTAAGGGCALNLNSADSEASSCPEGYQCSRLCGKQPEQSHEIQPCGNSMEQCPSEQCAGAFKSWGCVGSCGDNQVCHESHCDTCAGR